MINNKTVVVLGAGASKPYGYPIGLELRNQIIENFVNWYRESIVNHLRLTSDKQGFLNNAQNFVDTFKKSSNLSIDLFISRNPKFNNIGKLAIVLAIINSEIKSEYRNEIDEPTQDWYSYLYHRMTENLIDKNDISISNNQIDFITFNYDRSFDYFLYDSFNNSFSEIISSK